MIVDRRKDTYDELMLLSRDASVSRKRRQTASNWLIGSAIAVSGIFIAASSAHMSALNAANKAATGQNEDLRSELARVKAERDYYRDANDWWKQLASTLSNNEPIDTVVQNFPQPPRDEAQVLARPEFANIVWMLDGSRRYPVKTNDLLWIPEAGMWIRVDVRQVGTEDNKPKFEYDVFKFEGPRPSPNSLGDAIELPYFIEFPRNAARCIKLELHEDSTRPGFGGEYVAIEALYFTPGPDQPCGRGD